MNKTHNSDLVQKYNLNLMKWVGVWRKKPSLFVRDYLKIKLFLYQKFLINKMNDTSFFMYIAARGQGKSFIIALYCIVRCILYPETRVVIASGTKGQAKKIITEKIVALARTSPAIDDEIKKINDNVNDVSVLFKNGSKISAETSNDNSRGLRCNILILDEFRLIKHKMVTDVFQPMLNVNRQPEFLKTKKYENYITHEENKEIYISSAWYKSHWIWGEFKKYINNMCRGKDFFVAVLPYQLSIFHKLLSQERIEAIKSADNFDQVSFDMEYGAMFIGENDKSYFKLKALTEARTVTKTFIPPSNSEYVENKRRSTPKVLSNMKRHDFVNEIRLVTLDIALMGGNKNVKNDTSAFTCLRLIRDGDIYKRDVVYLKSIRQSISTEGLAIELKRLYYDFEADYVVLDANGNGLGVFDACATLLYDEERDEEYEPWACINDDETNDRTKTDGLKVVYTVKASAAFNHEIAVSLKSVIENKKLRLPVSDIVKREELIAAGGFLQKDIYEQHRMLYTYQQTTALINELVSLEYLVRGGHIKIYEVGTATKDRYSSLAYGNQYANILEAKLKEGSDNDFSKYMLV